jgi:hypothetical protein
MAYSFNARRLAIAEVDDKIRRLEYELRELQRKKRHLVREYYFGFLGYKWHVKHVQKKQLTSKASSAKLNK